MFFSDYFNIPEAVLVAEDVFDVSLVSDLPLFIDPFLIFESDKTEYQTLHSWIIDYIRFLKTKSSCPIADWQRKEWFQFKEVEQNWLGFSVGSNHGRGLGKTFSHAVRVGLSGPVNDFGNESVSQGSHVERMFLFADGVGKDGMSDFITNLCKKYLLEFTESFTLKHVSESKRKQMNIDRVYFDFESERWKPQKFVLPVFSNSFVLLTPMDMLTQKISWINRTDLFDKFGHILQSVDDPQRRGQINTFFLQKLQPPPGSKENWKPTKRQEDEAHAATLRAYPELANYYVRLKEEDGDEAIEQGRIRVDEAKKRYRENVRNFVESELIPRGFFECNLEDLASLSFLFSEAIQFSPSVVCSQNQFGGDLKISDDFELICTLAWNFDGKTKRRLPTFYSVSSSRKLITLEGKHLGSEPPKDIVAVSTKWQWAERIARISSANKLSKVWPISLEPRPQEDEMQSVFISYQHEDENWARWTAEKLKSAGYEVTVQYADFHVGSNFVQEMHEAVKSTDRTIALISNKYLQSKFAGVEWQAAFSDDPLGELRKLVPLRIEDVKPDGLLKTIVYADLFGKNEELATATLFGAMAAGKRPAETAAEFPGSGRGGSLPIAKAKEGNSRSELTDARKRMQTVKRIMRLSTEQINFMVWSVNPPDNVIPPINAAARERAKALLDWCFSNGFGAGEIESLIDDMLEGSGG